MNTQSRKDWFELNGNNFIKDSKILTILQLASRYKMTPTTVATLIKKYHLIPKKEFSSIGNNKHHQGLLVPYHCPPAALLLLPAQQFL